MSKGTDRYNLNSFKKKKKSIGVSWLDRQQLRAMFFAIKAAVAVSVFASLSAV